jgi:hypothetical protein
LPPDIAGLEFIPAAEQEPPAEEPAAAQATESREAEALWDRVSVPPVEVPPAEAPISAEAEEPAGSEETVQPLAGLISAEFQPPLQATGGLDVETSEEVVLEGSGNSEFRVPDASEDLKSLAARLAAPPPGPQGDRAEATEVVANVQASPPQAQSKQAPKRRSYLARDTNGQSVASFFHSLLAARPPAAPDSGGTDVPSRGGAAASPASPNGGSLEGEPNPDAAVSFDDFFSPDADASSSLRQGKSDSGGDDLDQFQSWLQNLKR